MGGNSFGGKILHIDLTSGEVRTEPTESYALKFLGGRGIDVRLLHREVKPWMTALDPANRLIFGAGILGGTPVPASSRLSIEAKSPVTGGVGSANAGGYFAPEMKYAGYDHIVIKGRARKPVFLWINDDEVEVRDASHLWGKTTGETYAAIKRGLKEKKVQIACIGPAGENLVRYAHIVVSQSRAAARCGLGAVMGSKNLKAVVVRGRKPVEVAEPKRFMDALDRIRKMINSHPVTQNHKAEGLFYFIPQYLESRPDRAKNFQEIIDPEEFKRLLPDAYKPHEMRRTTSFACPVGCFKIYKINGGPYDGTVSIGFPANTVTNFGPRLGLDYAPAVIKAHDLCTEYGLDEDAASSSIAWAFEAFQRGILTKEDTGGLELKWGDHRLVMDLLKKIAHREGIGDLLAEGSMQASQVVGRGSEEFAIHVKGADSYEPMRGMRAWALGSVVSTRGGTHLRGAAVVDLIRNLLEEASPEYCERWGIPKNWDPFSYEGKARPVIYCEKLKGVVDSLGICWFLTAWEGAGLLDSEELAELYSSATGSERTGEELIMCGARIHNLEKAFNVLHAGFNRQDDYPPERFMKEPVKGGAFDGEYLAKEGWDKMLDEYYELHGWDKQSGWQTRRCLEDLGLKEVADELEKVGRLIEGGGLHV